MKTSPPRLPSLTARRGALLLCLLVGCGGAAPAPATAPEAPHHAPHAPAGPASSTDDALDAVARIHGGAGPWAVAGYRMGQYALHKLGLERQSFDLEVIHRSPREVQFSCIADGAAAATGASLGKLNLAFADADEAHLETTYRRKSTGVTVTLRPTAAFKARFQDVPREQLPAAGRTVMLLPDVEVFEEVR